MGETTQKRSVNGDKTNTASEDDVDEEEVSFSVAKGNKHYTSATCLWAFTYPGTLLDLCFFALRVGMGRSVGESGRVVSMLTQL